MTSVPRHLTFDKAPQRVYWEITRSCGLACRHCRAEATLARDPDELSPSEGRGLLDRIARFAPAPHVILTGGDPLERSDLWDLIAHARGLGLHVSVSPSATPRLTPDVIRRFVHAGVEAISLSVDAPTPEKHDGIRGVQGCFARTMAALRAASDENLMVQINTLVCAETVDELAAVYDLARDANVARWSLFFLVSVGRGTVLQPIASERCDRLLAWLADLPRGEGLPIVTTTEAPHFRRVLLERRRLPMHSPVRSGFGIRDGNGVMFISHTGDVTPSGFLPMSAGNVRLEDPTAIYQRAPLFTSLRDATSLGGRCGECSFHAVCGGSRARAWSASGDPLAEDPLCTYDPRRAS